ARSRLLYPRCTSCRRIARQRLPISPTLLDQGGTTLLTSVTQLAVWWLLATTSVRQVSGSQEQDPKAETPSWFPRQRWVEGPSLEEFYRRWGKGGSLTQFPDNSPGGQFILGSGWAERLREKIPEWTR